MKPPGFFELAGIHGWTLLCCGMFSLVGGKMSAQEVPMDPSRKEYWVPTPHLAEVLKKHPNAVMLDAQQYEALVRDAAKMHAGPAPLPPVQSVVEDVQLQVTVPADGEHAQVVYTYRLRNLVEGWAELILPFPIGGASGVSQAELQKAMPYAGMLLSEMISQKPVIATPVEGSLKTRLLTQGLGAHQLQLVYKVLIRHRGEESGLEVCPPMESPSSTAVQAFLPQGVSPARHGAALADGSWKVVLERIEHTHRPALGMAWTKADAEGTATLGGGQTSVAFYRFHPDRLQAACLLGWKRSGRAPSAPLLLDVSDGAQILGVFDGDTPLKWQTTGPGQIGFDPPAGMAGEGKVRVVMEMPLDLPGSGTRAVALPIVKVAGDHPTTLWKCVLLTGTQVQVRLGEFLTWGNRVSVDELQHSLGLAKKEFSTLFELDEAILASGVSYTFDQPPTAPTVMAGLAPDRFSVDSDTIVTVSSHEISMARRYTFHGEAGAVSGAGLVLPDGETFLELTTIGGEVPGWKQVGRSVEIAWDKGLRTGQTSTVLVRTRRDVTSQAANGETSEVMKVASVPIQGASRVSGYTALDFDDSWKINVTEAAGLETRDVNLAPVKGRMAWFVLKDWRLTFDLVRRKPVYDAAVTAYALPRAQQVEIEGQINLLVTGAPLRRFHVQLPLGLAPRFRVASPLVGEQTLDAESGIWHFTLRKEMIGSANVRFRLSLPAEGEAGAPSLTAVLPEIKTPEARRRTTAWVVEANTDTEIAFFTRGVQPMDSLRPPLVEGYQPRHRVIAAYGHSGGDHEIKLTATRHTPASITGAVALNVKLVTVLAQNGPSRHEAVFSLQYNGRQFVTIKLPKGAVLLSTLMQNVPVKPVQGAPWQCRLPLPSGEAEAGRAEAKVVYETAAISWNSSGEQILEPPALEDGVPVLASTWQVFTPEGFLVQNRGGGLTVANPQITPTLLSQVARLLSETSTPTFLAGGSAKRSEMAMPTAGSPAPEGVVDVMPAPAAPAAPSEAPASLVTKMDRIILKKLVLTGASLTEAVRLLNELGRESDPEKTGVPLAIEPGGTGQASIHLDLSDVPLTEALRYVTELAGMKYRVDPEKISIFPLSDVATEQYTRTFKVPPDLLKKALQQIFGSAAAAGSFSADGRQSAVSPVEMMKLLGIPFPEGASAVYDAASGNLVVRNTQPNLDQAAALLESVSMEASPNLAAGKAGILPVELELPKSGRELVLNGYQKAEPMVLRYVSWEWQMARASLLMLLGAGACCLVGRRHPLLATMAAALLLTCLPLLFPAGWIPHCNALLAGWLVAFLFVAVWRGAAWFHRPAIKEAAV